MSLELILDKSKISTGCTPMCTCACCGGKMKDTKEYKVFYNYSKNQNMNQNIYKDNQSQYPKIWICQECKKFDSARYKKNDDLEKIKEQTKVKFE